MPDVIPGSDGEFDAWQTNFLGKLIFYAATLNIVPAEYLPVAALQSVWITKYPLAIGAVLAAKTTTTDKNTARHDYEQDGIRPMIIRANASATITDAIRADMGLPPRDLPSPAPPPPPLGQPVIINVDNSQRFEQKAHWRDAANPSKKAKPERAEAARVYMKLGDPPPASIDEMQFMGVDKFSPYTMEFEPADAGKRAHWAVVWAEKIDDPSLDGPQSEVFSATISG